MHRWLEALKRSQFYLLVGALHIISVTFLLYYNHPRVASSSQPISVTKQEMKQETVSGRPIHMKIPSLGTELPIDEGHYNPADATWTLSGYHAHFAMPTMPANNQEGNTLVYGHNNKYVFGPLKELQPGAVVEVTTDNSHLFYYTLASSTTVQPEDVSIFAYQGPPILTLQTCTGNWHELRTMYTFTLTRVVKYNPNAERDGVYREKLFNELQNLSIPSYPSTRTR